MLSSIAITTLRAASRAAPMFAAHAPTVVRAATARYGYAMTARRFMSAEKPYAVDAPDGDHDLQDVVRFNQEI